MTFGELPVGTRFTFASSPVGDVKVKTGFNRWKWDNHFGFLPVANGCRADREVIPIEKNQGR